MTRTAPPRRVTIVDVARHAQVSTTAVSKVLRNAYGVSPAMQAKVRQAMTDLGYRPHAAARGMRGQSYTVGVLVPDLHNPFFAQVIDGMMDHLDDTDYQILLGPSRCGHEAEARATEAMIDRSMDGVILIAPTSAPAQLDHIARLLPTVVIGRHGRSPAYDRVVDDDHAGAALVVDHLADIGHRRIAHIEHLENDPVRSAEMPNAVRAQGYRDAMAARGLADDADVVSTSYTQEGGYLGAQQLLARSRRPTAIFAGADIVAMGALTAIGEAGLAVPDDISVAGYDNTTFAALGAISLTTIDQAGRQFGSNAARLLLERIADRDRPSVQVSLSPALVVRRTTGPPPAAAEPLGVPADQAEDVRARAGWRRFAGQPTDDRRGQVSTDR
jgi:LacI family transcriptional regulator